jgi:hypothetical protein
VPDGSNIPGCDGDALSGALAENGIFAREDLRGSHLDSDDVGEVPDTVCRAEKYTKPAAFASIEVIIKTSRSAERPQLPRSVLADSWPKRRGVNGMAKKQVGEIRISKRVVQLGSQVYPLANISRVQTVRLVWGGRRATFYPLKRLIVVAIVVAAIVGAAGVIAPNLDLDTDVDVEDVARQVATIAAVIGGAWAAYLLVLFGYRLLFRRQWYALIIEASGTQYTALSGTDPIEIHRLKGEIVGAIEDPPSVERVVHVTGDVVFGDKVSGGVQNKQSGTDNRMFVGN